MANELVVLFIYILPISSLLIRFMRSELADVVYLPIVCFIKSHSFNSASKSVMFISCLRTTDLRDFGFLS